jgi:hypothetical protein
LPGLRADINLIDFDRLRLYQPELVHDMPTGGRRFVQGSLRMEPPGPELFADGEEHRTILQIRRLTFDGGGRAPSRL